MVKFIFAWYDVWIGFFYDRKKKWLYIFLVPCLGIVIKFKKERYIHLSEDWYLPQPHINVGDFVKSNGRYNLSMYFDNDTVAQVTTIQPGPTYAGSWFVTCKIRDKQYTFYINALQKI